MRCSETLIIAALVIVQPHTGRADARIDSQWVDKAKSEGKAAYERHLRVAERVEEECEWRTAKIAGPATNVPLLTGTMRERTIRLGNNMIVEMTRSVELATPTTLTGNNKDYHFDLVKAKGEASYALVGYGKGRPKYALVDQLHGLHGNAYYYCRNALAALGALKVARMPTLKSVLYDGGNDWLIIRGLREVEWVILPLGGTFSLIKS